jgi:RNA polymerase sigma-70 factor, ECF subfamily
VPNETMAKRLVRAKGKIRDAAIPYRVPPGHQLPERMIAVLAVLYALFNEGYGASAGADLIRVGLCEEAIRLATLLVELMPDEPEALGLLALMRLHHARSRARLDAAGDLVTLEEQDRTLWDVEVIGEACEMLDAAARRGCPGPYQVLAAIASCHATASDAGETDWVAIVALYDRLNEMVPSAVVTLNRAVAVAMKDGPSAGLLIVEQIEHAGVLGEYYLLPATRADLLRRSGRRAEAAAAYRRALELAPTDAERRYLAARVEEMAPRS